MADTELLVPMAEIAGVFVGFGALIAVRGGGGSESLETSSLRLVVSLGMLTVAVALAPGVLGRFDLTEHAVWALSSVVALLGWGIVSVAFARMPDTREGWATTLAEDRAGTRPWWLVVAEWVAFALLMALVLLIPIIIVVGVAPELEAALYYAVVVLLLLAAGWTLLGLVFAQRRPAAA